MKIIDVCVYLSHLWSPWLSFNHSGDATSGVVLHKVYTSSRFLRAAALSLA